jgi:radical SAM superfamily enzyme YgiQ (UPF0313 family)
MRICLIRPPTPELLNDRVDPPIGLLFIGTSLKQNGHEVQILDFAGGVTLEIPEADVYGVTLFTTSYPEALAIRDRIRAVSDAPIVAGGPHAQALPLKTSEDFDYVVVGEAELDFPRIVQRIVDRTLPERIFNAKSPADLAALPFNDYSLVAVP